MDERETDFKPDWTKYPRLANALVPLPVAEAVKSDLRDLLREARADAVRFIQDAKSEELSLARETGIRTALKKAIEAIGPLVTTAQVNDQYQRGICEARDAVVALLERSTAGFVFPGGELTNLARLVILESPLAPKNGRTQEQNVEYARRCARDSLHRGEAPFLSHLLYAQKDVLADDVPEERKLGIEAGLAWGRVAEATVVYTDYGISGGMQQGIDRAKSEGRPVEMRRLK